MSKPRTARHAFNQNRQQSKPATPPPNPPEEKGWLSRMWGKAVDFVTGLFGKVRAAFSVKEMTPSGKIINQSKFGKWVAQPIMAVLKWAATAVVWVARWVVYILLAVLIVAALLALAVLAIVVAAVAVVLLVAFRIIQGIALLVATPYYAYTDRAECDAIWENYRASWHPKYWAALKISDIDRWREFYATVKDKYSTDKWLSDENLWAHATDPGWSAA